MSQLLQFDVSLRLQCYRVPAVWKYEVNAVLGPQYFYEIDERLLSGVMEEAKPQRVRTYDPWELRLKFSKVKLNEPESLVGFLNSIGLFAPPQSSPKDEDRVFVLEAEDGQHVIPYEPWRRWSQDDLVHDQEFCRKWPCHFIETSEASFQARVAPVGNAPTLFFTATNFYEAYQSAFAIDQVRRARRAKCKRPDCGNTYPFTGNRERKYCSPECGHYMAVLTHRKREKRRAKLAVTRTYKLSKCLPMPGLSRAGRTTGTEQTPQLSHSKDRHKEE